MATPYSVTRLQVARSTQDVARGSYSEAPVLVVADRQDEGRGRSGAPWLNADRAVAMSLLFEPDWPRDAWGLIPLAAGVVVARGNGALLKWPNDIVSADGRKLGGILVETSTDGPVVVGVGLNLWWQEPPEGIAGIHLEDPGPSAADAVARAFADQLLEIVTALPDRWPRDEYLDRCVTIGARITWDRDGSGLATDIAEDGGLIVDTTEGRRVLRSGEIRHVRSYSEK